MCTNYNQKFISYALNLAQRNLGRTAPNPIVGCIIVHNGTIISTGITATGGHPHAETIAINKVPDKRILEESEIYITLEPCSHFGKTPPCVDEIIKNKFKKVIISTSDPDSRVDGKGISKLKAAGIEVICGILEKEAREINRGFFTAKKLSRPFVTLKLATSLDGQIATENFDSKWITSERARNFVHLLRAKNDAILVGANTAKKDNPRLDCRLPGLEEFSPRIVILSHENFNAELEDILKQLCSEGVNSLLIEGGQNVATQFLQKNLVDELIWIRNKKIIGSDGISAVGKMGFDNISKVLNNFERQETRELDEDIIEILRKKES